AGAPWACGMVHAAPGRGSLAAIGRAADGHRAVRPHVPRAARRGSAGGLRVLRGVPGVRRRHAARPAAGAGVPRADGGDPRMRAALVTPPNGSSTRMRVVRFQTRNPLVGIALLVLVLAVLAVVFAASVTLLAGAAVVGGVGLLARRMLHRRRL